MVKHAQGSSAFRFRMQSLIKRLQLRGARRERRGPLDGDACHRPLTDRPLFTAVASGEIYPVLSRSRCSARAAFQAVIPVFLGFASRKLIKRSALSVGMISCDPDALFVTVF